MAELSRQRGDTIIEVLVAVTVFSMIAIGSLSIMNQGLSISQYSLEITQVRQQLDKQAELLRFVHSRSQLGDEEFTGIWGDAVSGMSGGLEDRIGIEQCPDSFPDGGFVLAVDEESRLIKSISAPVGIYEQPATFARVDSNGSQGMSIQLSKVEGGAAYDAHIQACWHGPGQQAPATLGTIVRLYDPSA